MRLKQELVSRRGRSAVVCALIIGAGLLLLPHDAHSMEIAKGPYLQNPNTSGITVCWVSDEDAAGEVQFRPVTAARMVVRLEKTPARYHKIHLSGLKPYTRYEYRVLCGKERAEGSFRTAAPPRTPFKFVAYGDSRTQLDRHAEVLARIRKFNPDFIIQTGDQVADGLNEAQWADFWKVASSTLKDTPYYPALGNHEREGAPYFRYFDVPREYSFNYGNVHFVALDTNRPRVEYAAQEEWLKKDLAAHQNAAWRVVYFHHTPYTCVTKFGRRELAADLRARLEPIFIQGRVQLVVSGHDHDYQRHFAHGIQYVVTGGGGAPLYDVIPDTPNVVVAKKAYNDCEITVNGATMRVRAVDPQGQVLDTFEMRSG